MDEEGALSDLSLNSIIIDFYLWDYSKDHWQEMKHLPIHRIRSTFYWDSTRDSSRNQMFSKNKSEQHLHLWWKSGSFFYIFHKQDSDWKILKIYGKELKGHQGLDHCDEVHSTHQENILLKLLKTLDTIGSCQRTVFPLGKSHICIKLQTCINLS